VASEWKADAIRGTISGLIVSEMRVEETKLECLAGCADFWNVGSCAGQGLIAPIVGCATEMAQSLYSTSTTDLQQGFRKMSCYPSCSAALW